MKYIILLVIIALPHYGFIKGNKEGAEEMRPSPASCEEVKFEINEGETLMVIDFDGINRATRARVYTDEGGDAEYNYTYNGNGVPLLVKAVKGGLTPVEMPGRNTYNLVGMEDGVQSTFKIVNGKIIEWTTKSVDGET
ncbi:MAG: hypothetical protein ABI687_00975, partial [Flavitalea sp.]